MSYPLVYDGIWLLPSRVFLTARIETCKRGDHAPFVAASPWSA